MRRPGDLSCYGIEPDDDDGDDFTRDPEGYCPECGGENDTTGRLCSECREDDCLNCGVCESCIDRTIAAHEDHESRRAGRVQCEVCGRGLNAEDLEANTGMCIPCSRE